MSDMNKSSLFTFVSILVGIHCDQTKAMQIKYRILPE